MIDSVSMVVGCEVAAWLAVLPVVPDADRECEDALADACPDAVECAAAVAFEGELAFGGVDDRFDPLADAAERPGAGLLAFAVGAEELGGEGVGDLFELVACEALVADDDLEALEGAVAAHPVEERRRDLAFGLVGRGEAEPCGIPSGEQTR
jgi:hypothetical protein